MLIYAPGDATSLVIPEVPDVITTHDLQPTDIVFPDVWLIDVATRGYAAVLADLDLYRNDPKTYPPTTRVLVTGGYGGGKVERSARHD